MDQLLTWDQELFLWLNSLGNSRFDSFWMMMTHRGSNIFLYIFILLYLGYKSSWKTAANLLIFVCFLILFTDQLTNFFKIQVGRLRPCYNKEINFMLRLVKSSCGGRFSFFSGHASNSFALALFFGGVLKSFSKYLPYLLLFIASLIAFSRVYIGVHYPLDIFCGAIVGSLIGLIFFRVWDKFKIRIL